MAFLSDNFPRRSLAFHGERARPVDVAFYAVLILGTSLHFIRADQPLSNDEAWTGAIASQHSLVGVVQQALYDVNAPLYYLVTHYWTSAFGLSDFSLHLLSAIFAAAAAWLVVAIDSPLAKNVKYLWALLLVLWFPGLRYAQEARCYALLFFLATMNAVLYARLVTAPERRHAYRWSFVSLLLLLTHYHALLLVGTQGLLLLAWHRATAMKLWPALVIFAPFPLWLAFHVSTIVRFLSPEAAWYWLLDPNDLWRIVEFLYNSEFVAGFAVAILLIDSARRHLRHEAAENRPDENPFWLVALASFLPALFIVAMGFIRPTFEVRYLIVFAPGLLLGLALVAHRARRTWSLAPALMLILFSATTLAWAALQAHPPIRVYGFERASQFLMQAKPSRLIFLWDNPTSQAENLGQMAQAGGFFFKRAGFPIDVVPLTLKAGEDPNLRLVQEAKLHHAAILWLYDLRVGKTAARSFPLSIETRDHSLMCKNFGDRRFGVIACHERSAGDAG